MKHLTDTFSRWLPLTFLLLSAAYAYLLVIPQSYFPYFGLAFFFATIGTLAFMFKHTHRRFDQLLYGAILLLSFFLLFRANEFLSLLNILVIIYLGGILLHSVRPGTKLLEVALSPLIVFITILKTPNKIPYSFGSLRKHTDIKGTQIVISEHLPAIFITGIILFVTIPLLAYANPYFNNLVQGVIGLFNFSWLTDLFKYEVSVYIARLFFFVFSLFLLPRGVSYTSTEKTAVNEGQPIKINFLIPKIALSIVLGIFFITQAQLYFSTPDTLQSLGYSNSKYAREVFGQLSVVTIIIFLLVYYDHSRKKWAERLTAMLVIQAFFLSAIALKSVFDYTVQWGFTHKRLYGYAVVLWVAGLFAFFWRHYSKSTSSGSFIKQAVLYTAVIVLGINIVNFDYIIYHFAKATTHSGIDQAYLANLSADGQSYHKQLQYFIGEINSSSTYNYDKMAPAYRLLNHIEMLQKKYAVEPSLGGFNISEYREYMKVKDVNTEYWKMRLQQKESLIFPHYPDIPPGIPYQVEPLQPIYPE